MRSGRRAIAPATAAEQSCISMLDLPIPAFVVDDTTGAIAAMNGPAMELFGFIGLEPDGVKVTDLLGADIGPIHDHHGHHHLTLPLRGAFDVVVSDSTSTSGHVHRRSVVMLMPVSSGGPAINHGPASRVVGWDHVAEQCVPFTGALLSVAIGVVGLQAVNTDLCRSTGDRAIAEIHQRLRQAGGPDCVVERVDGSCFLALLTSGGRDRLAVERFLNVSRQPIAGPHGDVVLGFALGVSTGSSRTPLILFDSAVRNLELALERGAGSIEWSNSPARPRMTPARLAAPLLAAVTGGEIVAELQPVVALLSGDVMEFEAFARWPGHQHVTPPSMVELARDMGILGELRASLMASIVELMRRNEGAAFLRRVSINVSARELAETSFAETVLGPIERAGIAPSSLQIEITDAVPTGELTAITHTIDALREHGVRVALDGLANGAVSWQSLIDLDIDAIKVEADLLASDYHSGRTDACLRSILELAGEFGLEVVAKGVETIEHHDRLVAAGCLFGQGRLYGRPEAAETIDGDISNKVLTTWSELAGADRRLSVAMTLGHQLSTVRPPQLPHPNADPLARFAHV